MSSTACNITPVVPQGLQLLTPNKIDRTEAMSAHLSEEKKRPKEKQNSEVLECIKQQRWTEQYCIEG